MFCRNSAEGTRTSKNAGQGNQTRDKQQLTRTVKNTGEGNQNRGIEQLMFEDEEILEYVFSMINSFISTFEQLCHVKKQWCGNSKILYLP